MLVSRVLRTVRYTAWDPPDRHALGLPPPDRRDRAVRRGLARHQGGAGECHADVVRASGAPGWPRWSRRCCWRRWGGCACRGGATCPRSSRSALLQLGAFFVLAHAARRAWCQAGRTAIISAVVTYWLIPLSVLVLGEKVPPHRWVAAGLGLAGVAVLAGPWAVDWTDTRPAARAI